jgi:CBS domain-containing protein
MDKVGELTARELMRKRFSKINTTDEIKKVIRALLDGDAGVVAVFYRNKFVGEIHELDLLKLAVDPKKIPSEDIVPLGVGLDMGYFAKIAGDIVRRHDIIIGPETRVSEAAYIMLKQGVKAVPVMEDKKLLGILTERDILRMITRRRAGK